MVKFNQELEKINSLVEDTVKIISVLGLPDEDLVRVYTADGKKHFITRESYHPSKDLSQCKKIEFKE